MWKVCRGMDLWVVVTRNGGLVQSEVSSEVPNSIKLFFFILSFFYLPSFS